ncbi:MAG: restriction endonuclease subunit S [Zoogloea sp.]|nr:restriction endonuclease subunit S [Zoogloea sp.]
MNAVLQAREPSARYLATQEPPLLRRFELLATAPGSVARLRELILTLAVQGKLVPQDPNDEPASVLLERIRAEKARLVKEGKIRTGKPLSEIAEEEKPFELPVGWEWVRLADIVTIWNGRAYSKAELLESGTPVLRVGNLFTSNHWYYSNLDLEPEKYCKQGDLLYAWSASFGPFIWSGPKAIYHYHIWKLEPFRKTNFNQDYLYTFLSKKTREIKAAGHGVSMLHMTKEKMEKIVVPYPPLAEQSRVVARVEELMSLCDKLEAKGKLEAEQHARLVGTLFESLSNSESAHALAESWQRIAAHFDLLLDRTEAVDALEQTILQLAVRGLLVPQDPNDEPASVLLEKIRAEKDRLIAAGQIKRDKPLPPISDEEKPFELLDGWAWVRVEAISFISGGIQKTPTRTPKKNHFPYLRVANVQRERFLLTEIERFELEPGELERWSLKSGDILVVEGNGSEHEIGRCAMWHGEIEDCVHQNHLIRVRPVDTASGAFILMFLNSEYGKSEMKRLAITTSGLFSLSVGKIQKIALPLPPLAEQARIVARVEELRRLCADLRQRLVRASQVQSRLAEALVQSAA